MKNTRFAYTFLAIMFLFCFSVLFYILFRLTTSAEHPVFADSINISSGTIVIFVCIIIFIMALIKYNKIISLELRAKQSEKNIDVYLKQRFDLIPNLVDTIKAYAKYEKDVLTSIIKIRTDYLQNMASTTKDLKSIAALNESYIKLMGTLENYPDLKANTNFIELQKKLAKLESQLQAARRIYNMDVTNYNIYIKRFPSNIIAKILKAQELPLFEIENMEVANIKI